MTNPTPQWLEKFNEEAAEISEETQRTREKTLRIPNRPPQGKEEEVHVCFMRRRETGVFNIHRFMFLTELSDENRLRHFAPLAEIQGQEADESGEPRTVASVVGWCLSQFKAPHRDWELLRQAMVATNRGSSHWLAYYDERTERYAYGGVEEHLLDSFKKVLLLPETASMLPRFLETYSKPFGSNFEDFYVLLGNRHPEALKNGGVADYQEEIATWVQRRREMQMG